MRRTVETIKRKSLLGWRGTQVMVMSPSEANVYLATSNFAADCLTHLVRYATAYSSRSHLTFHTQCGAMVQMGRAVAISDEAFVCGRCFTAAEKHGEPTFGMIPTSGCEVSSGKRTGRPSMASVRQRQARP